MAGPSKLVRVTMRNRGESISFEVRTLPGSRNLVLGWVGQVAPDPTEITLSDSGGRSRVVTPRDRQWEHSVELLSDAHLFVPRSDRPFVLTLEYRVHPGELQRIRKLEADHLVVEELPPTAPSGSPELPESLSADRRKVASEALAELEELVGLEDVKVMVREILHAEVGRQRREALSLATAVSSRHLILTGAPGTGKTVVARLLAKLFWGFNLVELDQLVEVGPSELIGKYVGATAPLVDEAVDRAIGGVLFIDEAHMLHYTVLYGQEAVTALLRNMENHQRRLVVIAAGYPDKMEEFLDSDPGLRGRFTRVIAFPDYDDDSLGEIFRRIATSSDFDVDDEVVGAVVKHFNTSHRGPQFANAREVRNLFGAACDRHAARVGQLRAPSVEQLRRLELDDVFPRNASRNLDASVTALDEALAALQSMVGLSSVKYEVDTVIKLARMNRWRVASDLVPARVTRHFVFSGPPGTGKTTVAEHVAAAFRALGVLKRGHVVKATRDDLNEWSVGSQGERASEIIRSAVDGVLFLDEAYTLIGTPAVVPLLELMEEYRDRLVVVAAGYSQEMQLFLDSNAGLRSRFTKVIEFPAYSPEELVEIFEVTARSEQFVVSDEVLAAVRAELDSIDLRHFGNARGVRTMYERIVERIAGRMGESPTVTEMSTILPEDVRGLGSATTVPPRFGFVPWTA